MIRVKNHWANIVEYEVGNISLYISGQKVDDDDTDVLLTMKKDPRAPLGTERFSRTDTVRGELALKLRAMVAMSCSEQDLLDFWKDLYKPRDWNGSLDRY